MRDVQFTVALGLVAEIGDLSRFDSPRELMGWLGIVPSEYSSGARQRQGGITKAGNSYARRLLVEAAWSYRYVRSEEHTSELQSLMRISYAVFCLKKKK